MPKKKDAPATKPAILEAVPSLPLFERPSSGQVQIRVQVEGNNRAAGLADALSQILKSTEHASTYNGKARERVKQLCKDTGLHTKAVSVARQLMKLDPKEAIAIVNDATLILAEMGVFDAAEQADQAEAVEANAASVNAAEKAARAAPLPDPDRMEGEPKPGSIDSAAFYQGAEALASGARATANPYDPGTPAQKWWNEGYMRGLENAERRAAHREAAAPVHA
jgi:hypothetical protein